MKTFRRHRYEIYLESKFVEETTDPETQETIPAVYNYSTKGDIVLSTLGGAAGTVTYATEIADAATGHNVGNIKTAYSDVVTEKTLDVIKAAK